ncbi:MAG TPA: outer membrane lipoprotein-sorting protein [Dongiaceae bacterium]|nr:outer membrane lipoprotein-sorting protein [Dongiaceae bacterium]
MIFRICSLLLLSATLGFAQGMPIIITNAATASAEGHELAQELLAQWPQSDTALTGTLIIRDASGQRNELPLQVQTVTTPTNWQTIYTTTTSTNPITLRICHSSDQPTEYELDGHPLTGAELLTPFAGSEFWAIDLGLEFFHWPEQHLLRKEIHRTRSCRVLESINPAPGTNGYSRVLSWIDRESLGVVDAEAYDAAGKKLKSFSARDFHKVDGQWQLGRIDMDSEQTEARSQIKFDPVKSPEGAKD